MVTIIRHEVNESLAISGVVETRGLVFVSYCLGNIGKPIEEQINGAFDNLSERLNAIGLTLESVVKIDALVVIWMEVNCRATSEETSFMIWSKIMNLIISTPEK
ncbi:RidA family protein [Klebsiella pneumoniae]|uniref:RidA family protein n=1 Tax=Klebsiella pneumoniae TaxID=573 RepID=UPI0035A22DC7